MFKNTLCAVAMLAASMTASALTFERTTTINDDYSGHAVIHSAGSLGEDSGSRIADASFSKFHPRAETRFVDGTMSREAVRDGELVTVTYDGAITLTGNAGGSSANGSAQPLSISFVDLKIVKNAEEGPDLSGQLIINGQTIDAATAPAQVRAVLLGLLRFFRV